MVLSFLAPLLGGLAVGAAVQQGGIGRATEQALNAVVPNLILAPSELVDLHHRGRITQSDFYDFMQLHGYDEKTAITYYYTKDSILTPEQIVSWRIQQNLHNLNDAITNELNANQQTANILETERIYHSLMKTQGYRKQTSENFWKAVRPIPTFSEILNFMRKEVFEPEKIAQFQFDAEQPSQLAPYLSAYGVPDYEARQYWISHWNDIGYGRWDELYNRFRDDRGADGFNNFDATELAEFGLTFDDVKISRKEYQDYYSILEYSPYFRRRGEAATSRPIPFTALQQLWQYGVFDKTQIEGKLMDVGFSRTAANYLITAWERKFPYGYKEPLRNNIIKRYEKRMITRQIATNELSAVGVSDDAITFLLDDVDDKITEKLKTAKLKALQRRVYNTVYTEQQVRNLVNAIIPTDGEDRQILETEIIISAVRERATRIATRLGGKAFGSGNLTEQEFRAFLSNKYVSDSDIEIAVKAYKTEDST